MPHPNEPSQSSLSHGTNFCHRAFCRSLVLSCVLIVLSSRVAGSWAGGLLTDEPTRLVSQVLDNPRVVVVKSKLKLYLFDGDRLVRSYPIRLGFPSGPKTRAGDGCTPEGKFHICTKNEQSPNRRFLGISYPDPEAADRGLRDGLITPGEATAIRSAYETGRCPPWTTALGGGVGLHGSAGRAARTSGCIALRDDHIVELFGVLRIGDEIEILP